MIIFYYGSDAHRVIQAGREIVDRYQARYPAGLNLFRIDGEAPDAGSRLEDILRNDPLFQEVRLAHITRVFTKKGIGKELLLLLEKYDLTATKDIVLCICEPEEKGVLMKAHKNLFAYLEGNARPLKEFSSQNLNQRLLQIRSEFQARGVSVLPDTARLLANRVGDDSWALDQAIEKLANYRHKGTVQPQDVELLVPTAIDHNIFALVDAIASQDAKRSLELLVQELGSGLDPHYVLSMVTFQFRNLLTIKDLVSRNIPPAELPRKSGLAPFVARKTELQARKFGIGQLITIFSRLADLDTAAKQGTAHIEDELMRLVLGHA